MKSKINGSQEPPYLNTFTALSLRSPPAAPLNKLRVIVTMRRPPYNQLPPTPSTTRQPVPLGLVRLRTQGLQ